MIYQYSYSSDRNFEPITHDWGAPDNSDWLPFLESQGWQYLGHLPNYEGWEFNCFAVEFYAEKEGPRFLVEIEINDGRGLAEIFCPNFIDFLELIRDWALPLVANTNSDLMVGHFSNLAEKMTDGETGLPCARRYAKRDKQWRREARERRERESKTG